MKSNTQLKKYETIVIVSILLVFTLAKIPHLFLPHYWDEGWSYAVAVEKMTMAGSSMLSGKIPIELTRGHPLFFYASAASWLKIFGDTLLARHIFSLGISLAFLLAIFLGMRSIFNFRIACMSTLLVATQIIFFVQSSMLLPEIMVAFLAFLGIYFFSIKNYTGLAISLTLLLQTKESGLVLWLLLGAAFIFLLFIRNKNYNYRKIFIALLIPILCFAVFFIYQKVKFGWIFFPEHVHLMEHDINVIFHKLKTIIKLVFFEEKRKWLWGGTVFMTLASIYMYKDKWKRNSPDNPQIIFLLISALFIFLYSMFGAINFYSARYLIAAIVPSLIILAWLLDSSFRYLDLRSYIPAGIVILLFTIQNFVRNEETGDIGMYSYRVLRMQQSAVDYLLKNATPDTPIGVGGFLQRSNLLEPACGFLRGNPPYENAKWEINDATRYVLFDNMDGDSRINEIAANKDFELVYHYHENRQDTKIFRRK